MENDDGREGEVGDDGKRFVLQFFPLSSFD